MDTLFQRWSPVTSDFGLIHTSVDVVTKEFVEWQVSIGASCSSRRLSSFAAALAVLPPLSQEKRRALFVPTAAGWTAYFQSGIAGSDPFPAMSALAGRVGVVSMRVCVRPSKDAWPATIWEVYAPPDQGGVPPLLYRRSVSVANDGGRWTFDQSGEPYPFEHVEVYARPRKRERFTRELLTEYLAHFELFPFRDVFYVASDHLPAVLVERQHRWASPPREFSLEEVRDGLPWRKDPG